MNGPISTQDRSLRDQQAPWIALVLCRERLLQPRAQPDAVVKKILGYEYSADIGNGRDVLISCNGEFVGFLGPMPAPIPGREAEQAVQGHLLWPNGTYEVAQHQGHVVVGLLGARSLSPVAAALLLTRLTLVGLATFDGFGVYWPEAYVCHSREFFEDIASGISDDQLPVPLWIRCYLGRTRDGSLAAFTWGMHQFGLMDFEVERCNLDPVDLIEFLWDLANYLLINGPVIRDGDTVGPTAEVRIGVRFGTSRSNPPRQVYKLLF